MPIVLAKLHGQARSISYLFQGIYAHPSRRRKSAASDGATIGFRPRLEVIDYKFSGIMLRLSNTRRHLRHAFSLLEMAMAATLVAGTLIPTMAVMRDAMAKSRELSRRNLLSNYAVSVLEAHSALAMTNWSNTTATGNFTSDGHPSIRYSAVCSDAPANGGITGELMHIQVTVFDDLDSDTTADTNELSVLYRTKIANLQSYQDEE